MLIHGVTRREMATVIKATSFETNCTFQRTMFHGVKYAISGVTKDSAGAALGDCEVHLFYTVTDNIVGVIRSDANGNYQFLVGPSLSCYAVAYKVGSPDVAGTTVNTLVAVAT